MEIGIIIGIIAVLFYFWNKKQTFYKDRNGKKKIIGEFVKYESVTKQIMRNEYHTETYPFVKINKDSDDVGIFKLNFRNSLMKEFKKGEKVELFWSNNELLYWKAYDIGIMKYIPKKE